MPITRPVRVEQRATGVAGVHRGVHLDGVGDVASPPFSPEVETGRSTAETMPVVTVLARPSGLPTAMTGWPTTTLDESPNAAALRSLGGSVELDDGEVGGRVGADDGGLEDAAVVQRDLDAVLVGVADDVVVGHDVAGVVDDHAGALGAALPLPVVTEMATTEDWTALETASQSGLSDVEPETGTASLSSAPMVASEAGRPAELAASSSDSACTRPPVATAATIARGRGGRRHGDPRAALALRRDDRAGPCGAYCCSPAGAWWGTWYGGRLVHDRLLRDGRVLDRRHAARRPTGRDGRPRPGAAACAAACLAAWAASYAARWSAGAAGCGGVNGLVGCAAGATGSGCVAWTGGSGWVDATGASAGSRDGRDRLGRRDWAVLGRADRLGRLVRASLAPFSGVVVMVVASLVEYHYTGPRWNHPSQNLGIGCEFRMDLGLSPGRACADARRRPARRSARRAPARPARSTRTSTTLRPGPGRRERGQQPVDVADARVPDAVARAQRREVGAVRRAEHALEHVGPRRARRVPASRRSSRRRRWRRRAAGARPARAARAAARRRRAGTSGRPAARGRGGPAARARRRPRCETVPSMPASPRLATTTGGAAQRATRSRSRTGLDEPTTSTSSAALTSATARASTGPVTRVPLRDRRRRRAPSSTPSTAAPAALSAACHAVEPARRAPASGRCASGVGGSSSTSLGVAGGVGPVGAAGADDDDLDVRRARAAAAPGRDRVGRPSTTARRTAPPSRGCASSSTVGRDRVRSAARARRRLRQQRPAVRLGEPARERTRRRPPPRRTVGAPPRRASARPARAATAATAPDGPACTCARPRSTAPATAPAPGHQRLAEREVQVDGPGVAGPRSRSRPRRRGRPGARRSRASSGTPVGRRHVHGEADRAGRRCRPARWSGSRPCRAARAGGRR